ncbi:MAG: O-methyltransferase, partial [Geminicoccaceae bacterium]
VSVAFKSLLGSQDLARYVNKTLVQETELQKRLRAETARLPSAGMQVSAEQGAFLAFMVRLIGARRALEVGTFTGYSALCIAAALPEGGELVACDINDQWTGIAQRYWREAGVAGRISLRLAPAKETLAALLEEGAGSFDFAFIDADKESYDAYYEATLALLRPGGVMALDNMLPDGVWDEAARGPMASAVHPVNLKIRDDGRVDASPATIGAGMMLARKR